MKSFAKKFFNPTHMTSGQAVGNESRVTKYSLTSIHEPMSPVSGTSFIPNPEHSYISGDWSSHSGDRWGGNLTLPGVFRRKEPAESADFSHSMSDITDGGMLILWPETTSGASQKNDDLYRDPDDALSLPPKVPEMQEQSVSVVYDFDEESGKHLTDASKSRFLLGKDSVRNQGTLTGFHDTTKSCSSSSTNDNVVGSYNTLSDCATASMVSSNTLETTARFQRARRKRRSRELKLRRKTLDCVDFHGPSHDCPTEKLPSFHSKSMTPSPIENGSDYADFQLKNSFYNSSQRRQTIEGLFPKQDASESQDDEILQVPSSVRWQALSSDDLLTDCSKSASQSKGTDEREWRRNRVRRNSICASAVCVSEMMRCQIVADLDLLEENTEFEPCSVPFEDTVVLWPAAVDKPSGFECSVACRSWISSLEATGFVGDKCVVMATATVTQASQERVQLLFLFSRHLLFAEQKSNSILRLDEKIEVSSLWLSDRRDDIVEVLEADDLSNRSRSIVIGWPPINVVLTFATSEEKMLWVTKLEELIKLEELKESDKQLSLKVIYKERGLSRVKELVVTRSENAFQLLQRCLHEFRLNSSNARDYQLFIKWSKEHPEQPLLGHESPFLIGDWFLKCSAVQRKEFSNFQCIVLRERKRSKHAMYEGGGRNRSSRPTPLKTLFKRSQARSPKTNPIFGRSLTEVCADNSIPRCILAMFQYLYVHGPSTVGVFRKSGRHQEVVDFKSRLNAAEDVNFDNVSVDVVAAVVKEWLRKLPDCLLSSDIYDQWIEVSGVTDQSLIHEELKRLSLSLVPSHLLVLQHLMCVLHRIHLHSRYNRMTALNLAICIGPNILHPPVTANIDFQISSLEQANAVVRMLIESIEPVFGSECINLYQDIADPYPAEKMESNGDHESHENISFDAAFAQDCDAANLQKTNSLESLDNNDFLSENAAEKMSQSLENMSPDSGLATSNPHLYDDVLDGSSHPEGPYLKRQQQQKDHPSSKSELSEIKESQMVLDSDDDSLGSQASDCSDVEPLASRMHGARNVRERIQRFRNLKTTSEELTSSISDWFSISDDRVSQTDSVVTWDAKEKDPEPLSSSLLVAETGGPASSSESATLASITSENINVEKKDLGRDGVAMRLTDTKGQNISNIRPAPDDDPTRKPTELPATKSAANNYRLTGISIIPKCTVKEFLESETIPQVKPTHQRSVVQPLSPVARGRVERFKEGRKDSFKDVRMDDKPQAVRSGKSPVALEVSPRNTAALLSSKPEVVESRQPRLSKDGEPHCLRENVAAGGRRRPKIQKSSENNVARDPGWPSVTRSEPLTVPNENQGQIFRENEGCRNLSKPAAGYRHEERLYDVKRANVPQFPCEIRTPRNMAEVSGLCRNPPARLPETFEKTKVCIVHEVRTNKVSTSEADKASHPRSKSAQRSNRTAHVRHRENEETKTGGSNPRSSNQGSLPRSEQPICHFSNPVSSNRNIIAKIKHQQEDGGLKDEPRNIGMMIPPRDARLKDQCRGSKPMDQRPNRNGQWQLPGGQIDHMATICTPNAGCYRLLANSRTVASQLHALNDRNRPRAECQSVDHRNMQRSVTVIQLCDEDSVILRKTVRKT